MKKTRVKLNILRLTFSTGSASRKTQSKEGEPKRLSFDCARTLDLGLSRKSPFSTDKSDCVRVALKPVFETHVHTNSMFAFLFCLFFRQVIAAF